MKKMSCQEAQKMITPFINDELSDDETSRFLDHVRKCPDCYDELETYFIVDYSLRFLDNDNDASYDLKRLLKEKVGRKERELSRRKILTVLFPLLTIILILSIVMILVYENAPELFSRIMDNYQSFLQTLRSM